MDFSFFDWFTFWNEKLLCDITGSCSLLLRRSFSDSCFPSSPLCSELADVQWYGHDKAKPGTLVWDLPLGAERSPVAPLLPLHCPSLLPIDNQQPHPWNPTDSCPDRTGGLDMSLPPPPPPPPCIPPLHPFPLFIMPPPLSQLSQTGTHSLGSDSGGFHQTDWEVPPQLLNSCPPAPRSSVCTRPHRDEGGEAMGIESTETQTQTKFNHRPFPGPPPLI